MSRKLTDLAKTTQQKVLTVEAEMKQLGYPLGRSYTFRSIKEQERLYQRGRTLPGSIVTKTRRGWHNLTRDGSPASRAVDWYFRKRIGFCYDSGIRWNEFDDNWPWELLFYVAEKHNLKRTLIWDKGHFIDSQGQSFSQAWSAHS